jgi:hypothetical protein
MVDTPASHSGHSNFGGTAEVFPELHLTDAGIMFKTAHGHFS